MLLHMCTRGDQHKAQEENLAHQGPKQRPSVPVLSQSLRHEGVHGEANKGGAAVRKR